VVGTVLVLRSADRKGGVGVALVSSQRTANVERTWGLAVTITFLAGACYLLVAAVERWYLERTPMTSMPSRSPEAPRPSTRA